MTTRHALKPVFRLGPCAVALEADDDVAVRAHALLRANVDRGPVDAAPVVTVRLRARALDDRDEARGGTPTFFSGAIQAFAHDDGTTSLHDRTTWLHVAADGNTLTWALPERLVAEAERIAGVALLIAVAVALRAHGLFHLHCGVLTDDDDRGWLIGGVSGSGKTSTTVALLEAGLCGAGDDTAFLAAGARGPCAHGLAKLFHPGAAVVAAHPRLADALVPGVAHGDRRLLDPRRAWPTRLVAGASSIDRLVFPVIASTSTTRVEPLGPADAFGALLESAALVVVDGLAQRDENLALLQVVAARAQAVRLVLGRDALAHPAVIFDALARAGLLRARGTTLSRGSSSASRASS